MENLIKILEILTKEDIEPRIIFDLEEGKPCLDLNTLSKSSLYLFDDGTIKGRYNYTTQISFEDDVILDLCGEFKNSLHGRDYGNPEWFKLCQKVYGK